MNLIVRPEAETDLLLAYKWYEDEREQLGLEFMASVGLQLEKVASSPESYPVVYKGVRRWTKPLRGRPPPARSQPI